MPGFWEKKKKKTPRRKTLALEKACKIHSKLLCALAVSTYFAPFHGPSSRLVAFINKTPQQWKKKATPCLWVLSHVTELLLFDKPSHGCMSSYGQFKRWPPVAPRYSPHLYPASSCWAGCLSISTLLGPFSVASLFLRKELGICLSKQRGHKERGCSRAGAADSFLPFGHGGKRLCGCSLTEHLDRDSCEAEHQQGDIAAKTVPMAIHHSPGIVHGDLLKIRWSCLLFLISC